MDLRAAFHAAVETVPFVGALAASAVAASAVEVGLLVAATGSLRRLAELRATALRGDWAPLASLRLPSRWPAVIATLAPAAVGACAALSLHSARDLTLQALTSSSVDPVVKAGFLSRGISGEMNGTPIALFLAAATAVLACVAVGLAIAARLRAGGLQRAAALATATPAAAAVWAEHPGPTPAAVVGSLGAFVGLGLGPLAAAAYYASVLKIIGYAGLTAFDPQEKVAHVEVFLAEAARLLERGLQVSRAGVLVATLLAGYFLVARSPARARARKLGAAAEPPGAGRASALATALLLALAAAALVIARPLQQENALAWPKGGSSDGPWVKLETPPLDGPDAVERGPVVEVGPERTSLDRADVDVDELHDGLVTMRNNFDLLHPGGAFDGNLVVVAAPEAPLARVVQALTVAARAGFQHPRFVFIQRFEQRRPVLGPLAYQRTSAAAFTSVWAREEAPAQATVLVPAEQESWPAFAARVVNARRDGATVAVLLPPP